jgi:thiamine biosynthesis protein ThiS
MISLIVNGKQTALDGPVLLRQFLDIHGLSSRLVAVEHNGSIVPRELYGEVTLQDGDTLEIVHMMAGGR